MKITEEMVEKACIAEGGQAYWDELQEGGPFDSMHTRHRARSMMRRALEAVAPLIAEECARLAETTPTIYQNTVDEVAKRVRALAKEPAQ